eukprot:GHVN01086722.1.p1 GENE.GHVN01086722.1~~GHVN01086722.1.p1  ORF type:complete len:452 (-),score=111.64 GHVN01086722.1:1137-2492(-)
MNRWVTLSSGGCHSAGVRHVNERGERGSRYQFKDIADGKGGEGCDKLQRGQRSEGGRVCQGQGGERRVMRGERGAVMRKQAPQPDKRFSNRTCGARHSRPPQRGHPSQSNILADLSDGVPNEQSVAAVEFLCCTIFPHPQSYQSLHSPRTLNLQQGDPDERREERPGKRKVPADSPHAPHPYHSLRARGSKSHSLPCAFSSIDQMGYLYIEAVTSSLISPSSSHSGQSPDSSHSLFPPRCVELNPIIVYAADEKKVKFLNQLSSPQSPMSPFSPRPSLEHEIRGVILHTRIHSPHRAATQSHTSLTVGKTNGEAQVSKTFDNIAPHHSRDLIYSHHSADSLQSVSPQSASTHDLTSLISLCEDLKSQVDHQRPPWTDTGFHHVSSKSLNLDQSLISLGQPDPTHPAPHHHTKLTWRIVGIKPAETTSMSKTAKGGAFLEIANSLSSSYISP